MLKIWNAITEWMEIQEKTYNLFQRKLERNYVDMFKNVANK